MFFVACTTRTHWLCRYRPVGCSCGAGTTHLAGGGCISQAAVENQIAKDKREKRGGANLCTCLFTCLLHLQSSSDAIAENQDVVLPWICSRLHSSLLVCWVKVNACPGRTAFSVWAAEPFRRGRAFLPVTPNNMHEHRNHAVHAAAHYASMSSNTCMVSCWNSLRCQLHQNIMI